MDHPPRILLIEDDKRIAQSISLGLSRKGFDVSIAYDGALGARQASAGGFDLLLLDINLPGMNGFDVCRTLREHGNPVPILMLTALGEVDDRVEGLDCGADDYLVKPFDFRELVARIHALLRRRNAAPEAAELLREADLEVNLAAKTVRRGERLIPLTAREYELLVYLLRNKGRVLSKLDIVEQVWDLNFDTNTNLVEVYINYLRRKMDRDFTPKLIHTRLGLGYVLKAEP